MRIEDLKASISGAAYEAERRREEANRRWREGVEARAEGHTFAPTIIGVASFAQQVERFRGPVSLTSSNGYMGGISVAHVGGLWRLHMTDEGLRHASNGGGGGWAAPSTIAVHLLRALGLPHSPEGVQKLEGFVSWKGDPVGRARAVVPDVPEQVVLGTLARPHEAGRMLGIEAGDMIAIMRALHADGFNLRQTLNWTKGDGLAHAVARSEDLADRQVLRAIAEIGLPIDEPNEEEMTPLLAALANRCWDNATELMILGANRAATDGLGWGGMAHAMRGLASDYYADPANILERLRALARTGIAFGEGRGTRVPEASDFFDSDWRGRMEQRGVTAPRDFANQAEAAASGEGPAPRY